MAFVDDEIGGHQSAPSATCCRERKSPSKYITAKVPDQRQVNGNARDQGGTGIAQEQVDDEHHPALIAISMGEFHVRGNEARISTSYCRWPTIRWMDGGNEA